VREDVFDARAGGKLHKFLRTTGDFFEAAEKENPYPNGRFYVG
jgi:hypothetical protein